MTDRDLLAHLHRPTATLSASRRRADLIRPQESTMHDRYRIDLVRKSSGQWHAGMHSPDALDEPVVYANAEGPADVLERLGQSLDVLEAERLTRELTAPAGPRTVDEAVERALMRDVERVVAVLEAEDRRERGIVLRTLTIAHLAGIAREELAPQRGGDEASARARTLRALRRAQGDGVIVEAGRMQRTGGDAPDDGADVLWSLATDDQIEAAR